MEEESQKEEEETSNWQQPQESYEIIESLLSRIRICEWLGITSQRVSDLNINDSCKRSMRES